MHGLPRFLKLLLCIFMIFYGVIALAVENSPLPPKPELLSHSKQPLD